MLIAAIAAQTPRIRVGSGGVMLPHYSPLKVAETFSMLERAVPRPDRPRPRPRARHRPADDVRAPARPPPARTRRLPASSSTSCSPTSRTASRPGIRSPGSRRSRAGRSAPTSGCSAPRRRARSGRRSSGLPYAFADFINPPGAELAQASTRERFVPSPRLRGAGRRRRVSAICAETDEEAERLASSIADGDHAPAPGAADRGADRRDGARVPRG